MGHQGKGQMQTRLLIRRPKFEERDNWTECYKLEYGSRSSRETAASVLAYCGQNLHQQPSFDARSYCTPSSAGLGYWEAPEQLGSSKPPAMGCHNSCANGLTKLASPSAHNVSSWESCSLDKSLGSVDLRETRENEQVYQKGHKATEPESPAV